MSARTESKILSPEVTSVIVPPKPPVPNNPDVPLVHYRHAVALAGEDPASFFEELFAEHGWSNGWRNGVYPYHHFHSNAHEVLGVFSGSAEVLLGGPEGLTVTIERGDIVVIPAGVAHKRISATADLGIVGAYPDGQSPDLCKPDSDAFESFSGNVGRVPMPRQDPLYGEHAALLQGHKG